MRILRALGERNTLTPVLGSVYLKKEFQTSLYRSLQPLLFVFVFLVQDQEGGNHVYQKELQVLKAVILTPGVKMLKEKGRGFPVRFTTLHPFTCFFCSLISLYLSFLPVNGSEDSC